MSPSISLPAANEQGRRAALARFGYRLIAPPGTEHSAIWARLRSDFAVPLPMQIAAFVNLTDEVRARAIAYCDHRTNLDGLMDACDTIHLQILSGGPRPDLVEIYADARDRYEDAVETFGALRGALQEALDAQFR